MWSTFERGPLIEQFCLDEMSEYQTQVMDSESFAPANNSVNLEKVILQFKRLRRLRRFRHFTAEHFVQ